MSAFLQVKNALCRLAKGGRSLRRRLLGYMLLLLLLFGIVSFGCMLSLGHFSAVKKQTHTLLSAQLATYERELTKDFDHLAALGIRLSGELTKKMERLLSDEGLTIDTLSDHRDALFAAQVQLSISLTQSISMTDCSGAFFLLRATINSDAPNAEHSAAGVYYKVSNVMVEAPVHPKLSQFRGSAEISSRRISGHNRWTLEFDTDKFPEYERLIENAQPDLNACYLLSDAVELPDTWERIMLLCVPMVGEDGTVYGLCGFEISEIYYKLLHAQPGITPNLSGLLGRSDQSGFTLDGGIESGDCSGYIGGLSGTFSTTRGEYFNTYRQNGRSFIGLETPVQFSPLEQPRSVAVFLPKENFDALNLRNTVQNALTIAALFLLGSLGCVYMSHRYVKPILTALDQVRLTGPDARTNFQEIDDLLEFLAAHDEPGPPLSHENTSAEPSAANLSGYQAFVTHIETLSPAEKAVFDLYLKGHTATQIADILCLSINTIKTHNKRIYSKLNVTSRKELLLYVQMLEQPPQVDEILP